MRRRRCLGWDNRVVAPDVRPTEHKGCWPPARSIGTAALAVIKSRRAGHLCFVTGQFLPSQTRAPRQLPLRASDLRCG